MKNQFNHSSEKKIEKKEHIENEEQLIDIFKKYLLEGYNKETILDSLSKILNSSKEEILNDDYGI